MTEHDPPCRTGAPPNLALVLVAAVPSRRRSTRSTVADPGTGERIERSETDLI